MNEEYKEWDEPGDCPYCGCPNDELEYDVLTEENNGTMHDIVDCPRCKRRLFYED